MSSVSWKAVRQAAKAGGGIPEVEHNLILDDVKGYTSAKGAEGLKFRFRVEDGDYKGALVSHNPTIQLDYPGLVAQFIQDLAIMGVPENMLTDDKGMDEIAAIIMQQPRRCRAKTEVNEFNGNKSNRVKGGLMSATGSSSGSFTIAPPPPPPTAPKPFSAPAPVAPDSVPAF